MLRRRLGLVADASGGAVGGLAVWPAGEEGPRLHWPGDVEVVPDLVEGVAATADGDLGAVSFGQGVFDVLAGVGFCIGGDDGGVGEGLGVVSLGYLLAEGRTDLVSGQGAEELHCRVEIVYDLALRVVVLVAVGFERADAGPVFVPLVFPERRVVATEVFPVPAHVVEEVAAAGVDQDQGDVAVLPRGVAELVEAAIAVIGPREDI